MEGRHIVTDGEGEAALYKVKHRWCCQRCGNRNEAWFGRYPCLVCGKECVYCRRCIAYGRMAECTTLTWQPTQRTTPTRISRPSLQLAPQQALASQQVTTSVAKSILLHAVCGAGKTEILYEAIAQQLEQGHYVCIAAPRTDVILELAPRLARDFPTIALTVLHGDSEQKRQLSQLVLTTTHQLIHYKAAFHYMVVDEVDAFPFSIDASLQFIVQKATKQNGTIVYVSATPSTFLRRTVEETIYVPLRYHGYPLPLPQWRWGSGWRKQLPPHILQTVRRWLIEQKPVLLFVPFVADVERVVGQLREERIQAEGVFASEERRHERVRQFRAKQLPVIVATTILERGVTVENCQVAVLGSDEVIFTQAALIQMAGRVGRKAHAPTGDVIFYHDGTTVAMWQAQLAILLANWRGKRWRS